MSRVGLVLGGGGITGAAFQFGALLTLRMATGWDPNDSAVIVGTSCGALTAAMVRGDSLSIATLVDDARNRAEVARLLHDRIYRRAPPRGVLRWLRRGILPGLRRPDLRLALGSPAVHSTQGITEWVEEALADLADSWPDRPTVIVAYDLEQRRRTPFGTDAAPPAPLKLAVAASTAVPMLFQPVRIRGNWYADGGIASGTSADLVLGSEDPLDLVIIVAPLAAAERRPGARFYEDIFDRFGRTALDGEIDRIQSIWPDTEFLVLRPDPLVLDAARPNPMAAAAAMPAFLRTLRSMKHELATPETWDLLNRHLRAP